jgi:uncharacterized protein YihD (DUF1040 family)
VNRDQSLSLSKNVGLGSLGAFVTRALLRVRRGDCVRLDWEDRERFGSVLDLLESAWRGAQPLSELTAVREQARLAAAAKHEGDELPSMDQDIRNSELFLMLRPELKQKDDVSAYVKRLEPVVQALAEHGSVQELDLENEMSELDELAGLLGELAHVNDDVLDQRRALLSA